MRAMRGCCHQYDGRSRSPDETTQKETKILEIKRKLKSFYLQFVDEYKQTF